MARSGVAGGLIGGDNTVVFLTSAKSDLQKPERGIFCTKFHLLACLAGYLSLRAGMLAWVFRTVYAHHLLQSTLRVPSGWMSGIFAIDRGPPLERSGVPQS